MHTSRSPVRSVHFTNGPCENMTPIPLGCAQVGDAFVFTPAGSEIVKVRYYGSATWTLPLDVPGWFNGSHDEYNKVTNRAPLVEFQPNQEGAFFMFTPYQTAKVQDGSSYFYQIWARFLNRSDQTWRYGAIEVDWRKIE